MESSTAINLTPEEPQRPPLLSNKGFEVYLLMTQARDLPYDRFLSLWSGKGMKIAKDYVRFSFLTR